MTIKQATEKEKKKFFKTLHGRTTANRTPFSVMFELTYQCNLKCFHCYLPGSRQEKAELSTRQVLAILDQLKTLGVYRVAFTGGEALVRKDIFEILGYAAKCGFEVGLLSNGYLINEQMAKELKRANVYQIDITFNAMSPAIFDNITQIRGSFARVKRGVELLLENGIEVVLKATCMKINQKEILKVSRFARKLGVILLIDGEILPCRNNDTTFVDQYSISAKEHETLRRKVYPEMFAGNRPVSKPTKSRNKIFNCGVGGNSFSINPLGQMNFCLEINYPGYDIISMGAHNAWGALKKEVDTINRTKNFVCRDCDLFDDCSWCAGRSFIEGKGFNACSEYVKKRVLERREMVKSGCF